MFKVCIHHPLNPELSKKCLHVKTHMTDWVTTIRFPFPDNRAMADRALSNLLSGGAISQDDYEEAREKVVINGLRIFETYTTDRAGVVSFKVCIHAPFNPSLAKRCMRSIKHLPHWVGELEIPFLDNAVLSSNALMNMGKDGVLDAEDAKAIFERTKKDREATKSQTKQEFWLMSTGPILNIDWTNSNQNVNPNLNDPRISEIYIKYQD